MVQHARGHPKHAKKSEPSQTWQLHALLAADIWAHSPEGRASVVPASWFRLTGQSIHTALDWGWLEAVHPKDRDRVKAAWSEAPSATAGFGIEWRLYRPDGDHRLMRTDVMSVIDQASGRLTAWTGHITDITAERRVESLLAAQRVLLEQIATDAPLAEILEYLVLSLERQVEGMLGSILLLRDGRLVHGAAPNLPPEYSAQIEGVAIGPGAGSCGTAAFMKRPVVVEDIASDPLWRDYRHLALAHGLKSCWSTPILDSNGDVIGTFAMYHRSVAHRPQHRDLDLVEMATHIARIAIERDRNREILKQRTAALVEADRRKDEFLAMLAHELRNPLAPIMTTVQSMERRDCPPEVFRKGSLVIARQARVLSRLVDDLLDVSRVTRGNVRLERVPMAVQAAVLLAIENEPLLDGRHHVVELELPSEPVYVFADPLRITQVLSNLLSNAAKYTDPGGRIFVAVRARAADGESPPEIEIVIRDSGMGILKEQLPHVFDLFVQAPDAIRHARGGLGIGLTLVRRLIELHGGRVSASSAGPGRGSEFVVTLPRSAQPRRAVSGVAWSGLARAIERPDAEPKSGAPTLAAAPPAGRRILIIDDNADAGETLQQALELYGHEVRVAADGPSGLATVAAWHPDLALIDIGLPGMDGHEVARAIRATKEGHDLHLFALTGFGQPSDQARSLQSGFDLHLVKPVGLDELLHAIDEMHAHEGSPVGR